jgi:zinc transport system permease protein
MIYDFWSQTVSMLPFGWVKFGFMQNALLAVLLVSPIFAFLGCMVVNKQMAFFSDAIGHAGLTGIAIGAILGIAQPLWAMLGFSFVLAIAITLLRKHSRVSGDSVIGIVMSFSVALGIVILSRNGGFIRYSRFLIGDILSITQRDISMLVIVSIIFLLLWSFMFNSFLIASVNTSLARSRNISVWITEGIFASVTALVVTVSIQWIGILVINALLILPAAASRNIACSMKSYLWFAVLFCSISGLSGLIASFYLSTATGATIVLFAMLLYVLTIVIMRLRKRGANADSN